MRSVGYVVLTVVSAAAVGVGVYLWQTRGQTTEHPQAVAPAPAVVPEPEQITSAPPGPRRADPATAKLLDYYGQFLGSTDLAAFAGMVHPLALEGDDAAQFWLFRALWRCGFHYDDVFDVERTSGGTRELTIEQVLQREAKDPHFATDEVIALHQQCAQLRKVDGKRFGDAQQWLRAASKTGYPMAQIWLAYQLAEEGGKQSAQARELTIAALRSGDAEVIRATEAVAIQLAQGESARERHQWVWTLVGCKRGADCSPSAEWVKNECARDRSCESYEGGVDIIRRQTGPQFAELEEAAQTLDTKINEQRWNELGL